MEGFESSIADPHLWLNSSVVRVFFLIYFQLYLFVDLSFSTALFNNWSQISVRRIAQADLRSNLNLNLGDRTCIYTHTPSFDGRANTHAHREGAPASIRVLSVCPPVKFLGEMFGEMNEAKELEGGPKFCKQKPLQIGWERGQQRGSGWAGGV